MLVFPHICCCDGLLWPAFFSDQCVHFVGCHRDSVRGSDDAATSSERENGATALAPSSRTRPLGEPLQRTGTSLCLLVKNRQFKLTYKSICQSYVCVFLSQRMQLDIILTSLQDHTHVASLLGYSCPPDASEPPALPSDSTHVPGTHSDTHPDTHLAEILMKTLLRNLGFYTVSSADKDLEAVFVLPDSQLCFIFILIYTLMLNYRVAISQ